MSDTALMIAEERSVADVRSQVNKIQSLMDAVMQKGQHYGVIPGTSGKPSLLKPGAEKLCFVFRYAAEFSIERMDHPELHREYIVTCTLKDTTGRIVAQGVGSCSSMEKKYRYRRDGGENPNIADVWNTVLKMAKKRAHVDASITACAASDIFTQDIEDFAEEPTERNVTPAKLSPKAQEQAKDAPQADTSHEDTIRAEMKAETARFVEIMQAHGPAGEYFTDEDRKLAKSKYFAVKGATDENLAYIKTVVNEYQVKLWAMQKPDEPELF
jgi:hypothetical protein